MDDREQKRSGLAAAGLRAGNDIPSLQRRRNRFGLNGRRTDEPEFFDRPDERRVQVQLRERHTPLSLRLRSSASTDECCV